MSQKWGQEGMKDGGGGPKNTQSQRRVKKELVCAWMCARVK